MGVYKYEVWSYLSVDFVGEGKPEQEVDEYKQDDEDNKYGDGGGGVDIQVSFKRVIEYHQELFEYGSDIDILHGVCWGSEYRRWIVILISMETSSESKDKTLFLYSSVE